MNEQVETALDTLRGEIDAKILAALQNGDSVEAQRLSMSYTSLDVLARLLGNDG